MIKLMYKINKDIATEKLKTLMTAEVSTEEFESTLYTIISKYHSALNQTSVKKEKASLHKNLIKAHELSAERYEDTSIKMYHFD